MKLWLSWMQKRKQMKFLLIFLILGVLLGYIFFVKIDFSLLQDQIRQIPQLLEDIQISYIWPHFCLLSVLLISSFMGIGIILFVLYFLFEIACISYSVAIFTSFFSLSGFVYGLIYQLILKGFFLVCLFFLFKNVFNMVKSIWQKKGSGQEKFFSLTYFYRHIMIYVLAILGYDLFLTFWGSALLQKLCFILS